MSKGIKVFSMENKLFKHCVPIQVRFNDIDRLGHVSNTVYQNYYDSGKVDYIDTVLGEIDWDEICIVGASIKIDYIKPIFMKTPICVQTRVASVGNKSLTFEHRIINTDTEEVLSVCTAVVVSYLTREKQSIPVPELWREKIKGYESSPQ